MRRSLWVLGTLGAIHLVLSPAPDAQARTAGSSPEVWVFFSPSNGDLSTTWKRVKAFTDEHDLALRPCLLVEDFRALRPPSKAFATSIQTLAKLTGKSFEIRMWDDEGMRLAQRLRLSRLPAIVLLSRGKDKEPRSAHVVYGVGANLKETLKCASCK